MKQVKWFFKKLFRLGLWFFGISILMVILFRFIPVPFTPLMFIRTAQQWNNDEKLVWKHDWVSLDEMSPKLPLAVICSEDQKFMTHNGFDFEAIDKALKHNERSKRKKGASTISQQTAKNVFLWPGRTWVRKGLEVYFTFLIETLWSKERIIEVYLNSIEMGKGIYGAEAASQFWFKKSANKLTSDQAAALAAVLPNPRKYRANPPTSYIQNRKNWIVRQMGYYGKLAFD